MIKIKFKFNNQINLYFFYSCIMFIFYSFSWFVWFLLCVQLYCEFFNIFCVSKNDTHGHKQKANLRFQYFFDITNHYSTTHNNRQVDIKLCQTSRSFTRLDKIHESVSSLDKGNVKDGRVVVDKLEEIHLHGQRIVVA